MTWVPWTVLGAAVALVVSLRVFRARVPGPVWFLLELVPLALLFVATRSVVEAFPALAGFKGKLGDMPQASAWLLVLPAALAWGRGRVIAAGVMLFLLAFITWGDLLFWRQFDTLLPLGSASNGGQLWDVRDSIADLTQRGDSILLPVGLAGLVLAIVWPSRPEDPPPPKLSRRVYVGVTALAVLLPTVACVRGAWPIAIDVREWLDDRASWKVFSWDTALSKVGHVAAHARDTARTVREAWQAKPLTDADFERIVAYARRKREAAPPEGFGAAKGMNVLILQLEGIQSWTIGTLIDGHPITPYLNELRERALYFTNVWDQTGGSPTSDCEYLVLNSHHPLPVGSIAFRRASNDFVALPGVLKESGYTTFAAHAYRAGMWNRSVLYPRYGFERTAFAEDFEPGKKIGWGLSDKDFYRQLTGKIAKLKAPWFAYTISLTSHHPYNYLPRSERRIELGKLSGTGLGHYISSVHYVDEAVKDFFGALEEKGLLQDTLVVIYGDHESKLKLSGREASRAKQILDLPPRTVDLIAKRDWMTKKIPLFFVFPKGSPAGTVERVGGQIDIGATILHYLGVRPPGSFFGTPLVGDDGGLAPHFGGAVASNTLHFRPGSGAGECLDPAGDPRPMKECDAIKARGAEAVELSLLVTMHDLARRLSEAVPGKQLAERTKP